MIQTLLFIVLLTLVTGVGGLALGGLLASLIKRESPRVTSLLLSFTAGLMLCVVSFDMVPEAVAATGNYYLAPIFLVVGFLVTFLLNCWIDKSVHHKDEEHAHHCACGHHDLHTAGVVLAAAVALHNMPVGMAIGATFAGHGHAVNHSGVLAALIGFSRMYFTVHYLTDVLFGIALGIACAFAARWIVDRVYKKRRQKNG